ncbi:RNA-free ribonuclease [Dirofilaria immitis]
MSHNGTLTDSKFPIIRMENKLLSARDEKFATSIKINSSYERFYDETCNKICGNESCKSVIMNLADSWCPKETVKYESRINNLLFSNLFMAWMTYMYLMCGISPSILEDNVRSKIGQCLDVEKNRRCHQGSRHRCTL